MSKLRVEEAAATPMATTIAQSIRIEESTMSTVQYIVKHIKNTPMNLTELIEAQAYTRYLAVQAGVLQQAHYTYCCNLATKTDLGLYVCSDMEDEAWKRCFETNIVGQMPMRAGSVRKEWFNVERDGYPAAKGAGNEYHFKTSEQPHYGTHVETDVPVSLAVPQQDEWEESYDMQDAEIPHHVEVTQKQGAMSDLEQDEWALTSNDWLTQAEIAETQSERNVALAGGISTNKSWLI